MKQIVTILFLGCFTPLISQSIFKDDFNSPCSMVEWSFVSDTEGWDASQFESIDISTSTPGELMMMPYTCAWFQSRRGPLMFQTITGDFTFTTRVHSQNRAENDMPGSGFSLAGVMVREAKPELTEAPTGWYTGDEDYIFLSTGFASTGHGTCPGCPGPHFEAKNTTNGSSSLEISSVLDGPIGIRIVRVDDFILVLVQETGQDWRVHRRYFRGQFPDEIQVGLVSYTDWGKVNTYSQPNHNQYVLNADLDPNLSNNPGMGFNPDLIAKFEYAHLDSLAWPDSLSNINLTDDNMASDEDLLAVLGYEEPVDNPTSIWQGRIDGNIMNAQNWFPASIPGPSDDVLISRCDCPEVFAPILTSGVWEINRLTLENGAEVEVATGAAVNVRQN